MERQIDNFIRMSRFAGSREDLIQAGGGNTSVKLDQQRMLVKASGYQLADVTREKGFATVDYQKIRQNFPPGGMEEAEAKELLEQVRLAGERPSIETFLHAFTRLYTLHTHPVAVGALVCRSGGMAVLEQLFPQAVCLAYGTPGAPLASILIDGLSKRGSEEMPVQILFLKNHGLIVSGEDCDTVVDQTEAVCRKIEKYLKMDMNRYHRASQIADKLGPFSADSIVWTVTDENILKALRENGHRMWDFALSPDCIIYCGVKALHLREGGEPDQIRAHTAQYGPPKVVVFDDAPYICAPTVAKALEIQSVLSFSAQVFLSGKNETLDLLSEKECHFLLHWEAEKYRQRLHQEERK